MEDEPKLEIKNSDYFKNINFKEVEQQLAESGMFGATINVPNVPSTTFKEMPNYVHKGTHIVPFYRKGRW